MTISRLIVCSTALFMVLTGSAAMAQTDHEDTVKISPPLSLQESSSSTSSPEKTSSSDKTSSSETTTAKPSGGFWMFPESAPLGTIVTDRPGFSDSASLVPRGRFQIETGYTFTYDREHHRRVIDNNTPELALRTGLTDWLEFRTLWAGYSWTETLDKITTPAGRHIMHEDHDDGCRDLNLGFKLPVVCQKCGCWLPTISAIPSLYVPTGAEEKSANNVVPELKFPWNYCFTDEFSIYGSILGRVQDGPSGQFYQTAATLAAAYQFNKCVGLYVEYFGTYPNFRDTDCSHLLSAGPVFRITDCISLDTRVSVGLNEEAPDFQTSIGLGIRF